MQKIFLTGSTSYLGSKFSKLYGAKFEICGIARSDQQHPIDLTDTTAVKDAFLAFKPDFIIHTAADLGRDTATADTILKVNPAITEHLVSLAKGLGIPIIFTSTEAVYGGKEETGGYVETDPYQPRSLYGESKVRSEQSIMESGLPYLVIRGHRFVGINNQYQKPKQFPDTLKMLERGQEVHLDSRKLFKPTLINHICDVFAHYISHDSSKQIILNLGVDKATTFYDLVSDVAKTLGMDARLVRPDGEEAGWPQNSTLSTKKLHDLHYPSVTYEQLLETLRRDYAA
jgi:dTDP-4-dehydrorhamnose reductase